jgi:hypothetical protein
VIVTTLIPEIGARPYLEFDFGPRDEGFPRAILSTLPSGDMRFDAKGANPVRGRFFAQIGVAPERIMSIHLRHTRRVIVLRRGEGRAELEAKAAAAEASGGADGLIVAEPSAVPALTVADCMPIWLCDPERKIFGILHSGWRGTGILAEGVRAMVAEFGSRPGDIAAILGPSIGPCCYTVPEERALSFASEFGEAGIRAPNPGDGASLYRLDLRSANLIMAEKLGIGRLLDVKLCTACTQLLGSYRRQGPASFTRMLALCGYF